MRNFLTGIAAGIALMIPILLWIAGHTGIIETIGLYLLGLVAALLIGLMIRQTEIKILEKIYLPDLALLEHRLHKVKKKVSMDVVIGLVKLIDCRDHFTGTHSEHVSQIALLIGKRMGLSVKDLRDLFIAASLHDIGKVGIPEAILQKKSALTSKEYTIIKRHPQIGCNVLKDIEPFQRISQYVCFHHEAVDGSGYPCHLIGEEIPLLSRILAVADVYDALTSDRVYRKAMSKEKALYIMKYEEKGKFDPLVVKALYDCVMPKKERTRYNFNVNKK